MTKRIPFDLDKALAGAKVVTRDGRYPTEIYYFESASCNCPVTAVIDGDLRMFTKSGSWIVNINRSKVDLFIEIEEPEMWVNVYQNCVSVFYCSQESAMVSANKETVVATVPVSALIEWAKNWKE